jgi:hypothetical protein
MAYIVPKVLIQQEFTQIPVYRTNPLAAFIIGPQYDLARYSVTSERDEVTPVHPTDSAKANNYQAASGVLYAIPSVAAGALVDTNYTKVYFENVVATYFPLAAFNVAAQSSATQVGLVTAANGNKYPNRVKWNPNNTNYSTSALQTQYNYSRSTYFSNRDVQVGDVINITDSAGNSVTSAITALIRDTYAENSSLAASVGTATFTSTTGSVAYPQTNIFTDSSVTFTSAHVGQFLTLVSGTQGITGTVTTTGTTVASGATAITTSTITGLVAGTPISGTGIASGTTVVSTSGSSSPYTVNLSAATTASIASGATITYTANETTAIAQTSYLITGIQSTTSVVLDRVITEPSIGIAETGITYRVGGLYEDPANVGIYTSVQPISGTYVWAGATTAPSVPSFSVAAAYSGNWSGHKSLRIMSDTITATVTAGTNASNATFSISSKNGAFATKTATITTTGSGGSQTWSFVVDTDDANNTITLTLPNAASSANALSVGMSWTLGVTALSTNATFTAAGTYSGTSDAVYKLAVVRGGAFYDSTLNSGAGNASTCAQVAITASNGDSSTAVLVPLNSAITVGNYGVTATFTAGTTSSNAGLIQGDSYYINAKSATLGAVNVIQLADNLPSATINNSNTMYLTLSLNQKSIQVPTIQNLATGTYNWQSVSINQLQLNSGVTTTDSNIVFGGNPLALTVTAAKVYIEHRDLMPDNTASISSVNNEDDVAIKLGTIHPDNPLAQGVYNAVLNSNDTTVYFIGVGSDDLAGYNAAIAIAQKSDAVYGFVPLTFDRTIQQAVVAHVNAYSTPSVGLWRVAWLSQQDSTTAVLYGTNSTLGQVNNTTGSTPTPWVATVADDPINAGTQYTLVTMPGATLITNGIRAGDSLRINFGTDTNGNQTYSQYTVSQVRSQTSFTITSGLSAPIVSPVLAQIVRNYTLDERANNIAAIAGSYKNRRVRVVFPDSYKYNEVTYSGYFMAAALAGLRAGVVPHQGLTNTVVLGADNLNKVVNVFNQDQLNVMASQGVWLVTQSIVGATPYVRHQLTSDATSLNTSEDSITTNVDNMSYGLKRILAPYIGTYNINPGNIQVIRDAIINQMNFYATQTYTARAGNQLVSFSPATDILQIQQNTNYKDRIDVSLQLHVPYPLNYINLLLVV